MADRVIHEPAGWPTEDTFTRQLTDPAFFAAVVEAMCAGTLPGRLEALMWRLRFGEPPENSDDVDR